MKNISLTSIYNVGSGYANVLETLLTELPKLDIDLYPRTYTSISERFNKYFYNASYNNPTLDFSLLPLNNELTSLNPLYKMIFDKPRVLYTMWESTRLNDLLVEILNKFECIIVPNQYNKVNFINQGIIKPIFVVPLFCDTSVFTYSPHIERPEFFFGVSNEDPRKNLQKVISCFLKAFNKTQDVKMFIKTCGRIERSVSSKLNYIDKRLDVHQLVDWYHNLDVYVSGATCEGWGMMQQESMCCGRPIIYTKYGGLKEFVNEENGFSVSFKEVESTGFWGGYGGKWSEFDESDMIEKMIYCYNNRDVVKSRGLIASKQASIYTKENFIKNIYNIIEEYI